MKYNKFGEAYMVLSYFNLGLEHYTRVKFFEDGAEEVFLTENVKTGDFHSENYKVVVTKSLDAVVEPEPEVLEEVEVYQIKATTPKGKTFMFNSEDIEDVASNYKLDAEAIKSCVTGEQKTHRRWEFVKVD